jgi:hypothetical protein
MISSLKRPFDSTFIRSPCHMWCRIEVCNSVFVLRYQTLFIEPHKRPIFLLFLLKFLRFCFFSKIHLLELQAGSAGNFRINKTPNPFSLLLQVSKCYKINYPCLISRKNLNIESKLCWFIIRYRIMYVQNFIISLMKFNDIFYLRNTFRMN